MKLQYPAIFRRVARIWNKGELFWKSETTASDLDPTFNCSWIRITRNWEGFSGQNWKFERFFSPKSGDLPKKKNVFSKIETDFSAKVGNSNGFSTQKQVISKKKKNWDGFFGQNWKFNGFSGRITATTSQLRHPNSFGGGLFSFFQQKSASKTPKTCNFAYYTGQWGIELPP